MIAKSDFNPECITPSQMKMIFNARLYYRRLTAWARAYILSRYLGVGTADELFARLYLEALDQADMTKIIFGREDSNEYSQLLGGFTILLRDVITAQIDGDAEAMDRNVALLAGNVEERAAILHDLNPYWSEEEYRSLLSGYIRYLIDMANMMAAGDYERDSEIYDNLRVQSHRLGDVFAEGLYNFITSGADENQFTPGYGGPCIPYDQLDVVFGTQMFWLELAVWTRNYMLSRFIGFGASDRAFEHLSHVADDFVKLVEESTAFLTGDFARSLDIFGRLMDQAEMMANEFEKGFLHYLESRQTEPSLKENRHDNEKQF